MAEIKHGTYSGYQQHRKHGEQACEECKRASAEYMKTLRQRPRWREREKTLQSQRDRALRVLGRRHPTELAMILEEIRQNEENP